MENVVAMGAAPNGVFVPDHFVTNHALRLLVIHVVDEQLTLCFELRF